MKTEAIPFTCNKCGHAYWEDADFFIERKPIRVDEDTYQFTAPFCLLSRCNAPSVQGPCNSTRFKMKDSDLNRMIAEMV